MLQKVFDFHGCTGNDRALLAFGAVAPFLKCRPIELRLLWGMFTSKRNEERHSRHFDGINLPADIGCGPWCRSVGGKERPNPAKANGEHPDAFRRSHRDGEKIGVSKREAVFQKDCVGLPAQPGSRYRKRANRRPGCSQRREVHLSPHRPQRQAHSDRGRRSPERCRYTSLKGMSRRTVKG